MSSTNAASFDAISSTSIVHRPFGAIGAYRKVSDDASRIAVHAFPFAQIQQIAAAGLLGFPGCYALVGETEAYIGETSNVLRRILEHAGDASKSFVKEVFVVGAFDGRSFDKAAAISFQYRLTNVVQTAGLVTVLKGTGPQETACSDSNRSTLDRVFNDARRLLYDAGCRICDSNYVTRSREPDTALPVAANDASADAEDDGPMQIGVTTTPEGAEEFELLYGTVWARGYYSGEHFIVAAGSDFRIQTNDSVNAITRNRRDELVRAGVLVDIPGISDRRRLMVAVAFPSISIAGKVVSGAHLNSTKWQPLRVAQRFILAA